MNRWLSGLLTLALCCLCLSAASAAEKPHHPDVTVTRASCELETVMYDWDFSISDHGFTTVGCDGQGGAPVWAWGPEGVIPDAPANVWGTVLNGDYPNNAGEGLVSPVFTVTPDSYLLEILNYVHVENNYDGGNVKVNGEVIEPVGGYTHPIISESVNFYAFCVDGQPGFSGNGFSGPSQVWLAQCFDLSAYMGLDIQVQFDFGTDSSVSYPGWYLGYVRVGTDEGGVATESRTLSDIKATFH